MQTKLIQNDSKNLIIFLTGWGCDSDQFKFMYSKENDVLIVYDYSNLNFDIDISNYDKYYLVSFSAGVFVAGMIKDILPKFEKTIAINGNPIAYDEYFGLNKNIVNVFNGVTKETALDFRRKYLTYNEKEFRLFNANQSHRSFDSCKEELKSLKQYDATKPECMKFDLTILSNEDKIFNPKHQKEYWEQKTRCLYLENSAHFPFFRLNNFDEIIRL